jgi:hypothetical protein
MQGGSLDSPVLVELMATRGHASRYFINCFPAGDLSRECGVGQTTEMAAVSMMNTLMGLVAAHSKKMD